MPFTAPGDGAYAFNGEVYSAGPPGAIGPVTGGLAEARYAVGVEEGMADGMWAVASLTDASQIDLRRDLWGIKPLWVRQNREEVVACSDVAALVHEPGKTAPPVRMEAIAQLLLCGSVVDGGSYWEGVFPLPPSTGMCLNDGQATWLSGSHAGAERPADASLPRPIETAMRDSVKAALQADRPLGAAVSGGLDSSIVALHVQEAGVEDFTTVSVTPHGTRDGITDLRLLGLPDGPHQRWHHHHVTVKPQAALEGLRRATELAGVPTSLTSTPLYLALAEAARETNVVVLLVGEGADELFGGYHSYMRITSATTPADFYLNIDRCELVALLLGPSATQDAVAALRDRLGRAGTGPAAILAHERTLSLGPLLDRTDAIMMSLNRG